MLPRTERRGNLLHLNVERYTFRTDQANVIRSGGEIRLPGQRFDELPFIAKDLFRRRRCRLELEHAADRLDGQSLLF